MVARWMVFALAGVFAVSPSQRVSAETSVLDRVMTVDDSGLADCLRVAVENIPAPKTAQAVQSCEAKRLETIKAVTESYAQIRLFDTQIEEINKRLRESPLPDGLSHELVVAKAEMEMKRTAELARLRVTMGVLPRYALGQWPADHLNGWVVLDVVDANQVFMFAHEKPFYDYFLGIPGYPRVVGLKSGQQVEAILSEWMARKDVLPLRIEILRTTEGDRQGTRLFGALEQLARKTGTEMSVDLRLGGEVRARSRQRLFIVGDKIGTYEANKGTTENGATLHGLELVIAPSALESWMRDRLEPRPPGRFPMDWVVEYHAGSQELAAQVAKQIQAVAREKGVEPLVRVVLEPTKSVWEIDLQKP